MMKILLAIDGSKSAQAALRMIPIQVRPEGNQVRVLHVLEEISSYLSADLIPHGVRITPNIERDRREQGNKLLQQAAATLRKQGFRTSQALETGDPKEKIIQHAARWGADLIILGSLGLKGLSRFLMGSISEGVTRHAPCSVEVVRTRENRQRKHAASPKRQARKLR